jgi:hypothetical protein
MRGIAWHWPQPVRLDFIKLINEQEAWYEQATSRHRDLAGGSVDG